MDIDAYISYHMKKDNKTVACVLTLEDGVSPIVVETSIDKDGHYVDACLKLLSAWLLAKSEVIGQKTESIWIHLHFHRSASNLKAAFLKCKDTAHLCRDLPLAEQKKITKQKLMRSNYIKPVSYWSQVELVQVLVKLGKVYLTCETASQLQVERAYLLACANYNEYLEKSQQPTNVLEFKREKA